MQDAHKAELKVFVAGFADDFDLAYDHDFDPLKEYLIFMDNDNFLVDGLPTYSLLTASAATCMHAVWLHFSFHVLKIFSNDAHPLPSKALSLKE